MKLYNRHAVNKTQASQLRNCPTSAIKTLQVQTSNPSSQEALNGEGQELRISFTENSLGCL